MTTVSGIFERFFFFNRSNRTRCIPVPVIESYWAAVHFNNIVVKMSSITGDAA